VEEFFRFLDIAQIEIVPFSEEQARGAIVAYGRFGRSSGHPARLNFGDCFAYALARAMDLPLLYKGDDFSRTDIRSAL
jgi:ribonuclease VapC